MRFFMRNDYIGDALTIGHAKQTKASEDDKV